MYSEYGPLATLTVCTERTYDPSTALSVRTVTIRTDRTDRTNCNTLGAIHSTKISGNFGPKLDGSVRSNRKSFEKTGPPFEVDHFSRSDRLEFWLNGSRPPCSVIMRYTLRMCSKYGPLATLTVCTERTIRQLLLTVRNSVTVFDMTYKSTFNQTLLSPITSTDRKLNYNDSDDLSKSSTVFIGTTYSS